MGTVRRLETQTEAFWRDEYQVSAADEDLLASMILEAVHPQPILVLAAGIIKRRLESERDQVAQRARMGNVYQPSGRFNVGDQLVFTGRDFVTGTVVSKRPGENPLYGAFEVIRVVFDEEAEVEFASGLDITHPLNRPVEELLGGGDPNVSDASVVVMAAKEVSEKLQDYLVSNSDFVEFDGSWFLRELLPEISEGHLNLAEAVLDIAGAPMSAAEVLSQIGLSAGGTPEAQAFALNAALEEDGRFDNVSLSQDPLWYLRAHEPASLFEDSIITANAIRAAGSEYLGVTMLDVVEAICDEMDNVPSVIIQEVSSYSCILPFYHVVSGTLPVPNPILRQMPETTNDHYAVTIVDGKTSKEITAWMVPGRGVIAGLDDWFEANGVVIGTIVQIELGDNPRKMTLSVTKAKSSRAKWTRTATIVDGGVDVQMSPATSQIKVEVDPEVYIDTSDRGSMVALLLENSVKAASFSKLLRKAFSELAGLSGRGLVHSRALYSVLNLQRRCGAVPVFAELTRCACFDPVGDGFWAYDASLEGQIYKTVDDMRERPLSTRDDRVKDQAVPYLGR